MGTSFCGVCKVRHATAQVKDHYAARYAEQAAQAAFDARMDKLVPVKLGKRVVGSRKVAVPYWMQ